MPPLNEIHVEIYALGAVFAVKPTPRPCYNCRRDGYSN